MLRDNLQRVTPPLQLVLQLFEKEPITIRHNQNAADIFKYSVGVKYNLIVGRKTSCVRPTTATCNLPRVTWPLLKLNASLRIICFIQARIFTTTIHLRNE